MGHCLYPQSRGRLHPVRHGRRQTRAYRRGAPAALRGDDACAGAPSPRAASALLSNAAARARSWSRPCTAIAPSAGRNPRLVYPRRRLAAFPHRRSAPRRPRSPGRHLHPASRDVALRREGISSGRCAALAIGSFRQARSSALTPIGFILPGCVIALRRARGAPDCRARSRSHCLRNGWSRLPYGG